MTRPSLALSVIALVALTGPAPAGITFGPVRSRPGVSVRLVSHSETPGGTLELSLELKGTLTSNTSKPGASSKLILPISLVVTKSFVTD